MFVSLTLFSFQIQGGKLKSIARLTSYPEIWIFICAFILNILLY